MHEHPSQVANTRLPRGLHGIRDIEVMLGEQRREMCATTPIVPHRNYAGLQAMVGNEDLAGSKSQYPIWSRHAKLPVVHGDETGTRDNSASG